MSHRSEVLVVGGGVIGSSIAYHLASQGRRVLVVERTEVAAEPSASWASAGGLRRQGRHAAEAALARESMARWPRFATELDVDLGYRQGGNLLLAENDGQAVRLASFVGKQKAMGFDDVRLVDRREIAELAPHLADHFVAGSFSASDGQADPRAATRALARAAARHGAVYWTGTATATLVLAQGRVRGARTARGDVEADEVVVAAGAWSDELVAGVGLRLPMRTAVYQMLRSTPARDLDLRPVVACLGYRLSLKQVSDGSCLLGGGWPGDIAGDRTGYALREESIAGNWSAACAVLPALAALRVDQAWCGLEAQSIDDLPFVGAVPAVRGLWVATGFSGHGFAIAPAVGRAMAELIAGRPVPELRGLSPARVERLDPKDVAAFLAG